MRSSRYVSAIRHLSANLAPGASRLVERDDELEVIESAVDRVRHGGGEAIVLEADAGLGKTALLDQAAGLAAAADLSVRRVAPSRLERSFPFGVVRGLLEEPARAFSERRYPHPSDGPAHAAAELLASVVISSTRETTAIAHDVYRLCARLSEARPIALLVDDAHWSDPSSLEVMSYLARRLDDVSVLLVLSARANAPGTVGDLLGLIGVARATSVLRPRPLTPTGAVRLIHTIAPTAPVSVCADYHRETAGNPWLLTELARQLARDGATPAGGPRAREWSISGRGREAVRQRLAELEPRERAVASALAILEPDAPAPRVAALTAGVAIGELGGARQALSAAGLLAPGGRGLAHAWLAAAIRDGLAPAERDRLHRAAGTALIEEGAGAETAAAHLLRCEPAGDPRVTEALRVAATDASGRGSPAAAVRYLERAERERATDDEHGLILAELATAAFDAGLPGSRERLRESLREAFLPPCRIDVLTRLAGLSIVDDGDSELAHMIELELAAQPDPDVKVAVEAAALDTLVVVPDRHAERRHRAEAIELTSRTEPLVRRVVLAHRAWLGTELGTPNAAACAQLVGEALSGQPLVGEAWRRSAFHLCVRVLVMCDRGDEAGRALATMRQEANARGSLPLRTAAAFYAAELALRVGDLSAAAGEAQHARALAGEELGGVAGGAIAVLLWAWAEAGEFARARELLAEHRLDAPTAPPPWAAGVRFARARLALGEGDFERAYADALEAGALREREGRVNPTWTPWRSTAALALAHLDRREEAAALAEAELVLAERFGAPIPIARALHACAVADADHETRIELCTRSLAVIADAAAPLERVRVQLELGDALASLGRRTEARAHLRPALATADAIAAIPLAERARRALVATGLRPRRAALDGEAALTPRQRQILRLAAAGKTNKAIAQELFLSIKTVETHLAAGYRKLGVSSRDEIAIG